MPPPTLFLLLSASLIFAPTRGYIIYAIEVNVKLLHWGPKIKLQKSTMQDIEIFVAYQFNISDQNTVIQSRNALVEQECLRPKR